MSRTQAAGNNNSIALREKPLEFIYNNLNIIADRRMNRDFTPDSRALVGYPCCICIYDLSDTNLIANCEN